MDTENGNHSLPDNLGILRELCLKNGLAYRGTKANIKERLVKHGILSYKIHDDFHMDFDGMKLPELKLECKKRLLSHSK